MFIFLVRIQNILFVGINIYVLSAGQLFSEDDVEKVSINQDLFSKPDSTVSERKSDIVGEKECLPEDMPIHVLKCKSVFKCRICPRIICLTEETLKAHLQSKVTNIAFFFLLILFIYFNP